MTFVGHAVTQREQAVHLEVNDAIPIEPGGETGYSLSSFTVESFVGVRDGVLCANNL